MDSSLFLEVLLFPIILSLLQFRIPSSSLEPKLTFLFSYKISKHKYKLNKHMNKIIKNNLDNDDPFMNDALQNNIRYNRQGMSMFK